MVENQFIYSNLKAFFYLNIAFIYVIIFYYIYQSNVSNNFPAFYFYFVEFYIYLNVIFANLVKEYIIIFYENYYASFQI